MASSKAPFLVDTCALFCDEEDYWDNGDITEGGSFAHPGLTPQPFVELLRQNLWDDEELRSLLKKEKENGLYSVFEESPCLGMARTEAVEWILKVVGYYSFSALTAVLAVNYLDRFLFSFQCHLEKPWMTHLAAVTCLSLAAKVEETQVPLLLDLQVEDSKYVFESKTIQRMEILVLSTLKWHMNPVTPLSFLDYVAARLALDTYLSWEFLRRCHSLILSIISDCRFVCYHPSALAAATLLYVIRSVDPCCIDLDHLVAILGINKEQVMECSRLVKEVGTRSNKRKFGSFPGSPIGVMDVSFSCDSSASSSPDPLSKKIKSLSP